MRLYLLLSLLAHIIIFYLLIFSHTQEEDTNTQSSVALNEIIEIEYFNEGSEENNDIIEKDEAVLPPQQVVENDCEKYYIGVGIIISYIEINGAFLEVINEVKKGYGAWQAGLQPGDIIIETSEPFRADKEGTYVIAVIERDGKRMTFSIRRGKVCTT